MKSGRIEAKETRDKLLTSVTVLAGPSGSADK